MAQTRRIVYTSVTDKKTFNGERSTLNTEVKEDGTSENESAV